VPVRRRAALTYAPRLAAWVILGGAAAAGATAGAGAAVGQGEHAIELRIHPRVGDTIRSRLEQHVEMIPLARDGTPDSSSAGRSTMSMLALLRNVVEATAESGTTLLVTLDSVALAGTGAPLPVAEMRGQLQGKRVRMRVSPQGAMTLLDSPDAVSADVQSALAHVPATLPARPVAVGDTWSQATTVPVAGEPTGRGAMVRATFRLDSVVHGGERAYVSMRGVVLHDAEGAGAHPEKRAVTGTLTGGMLVDRRRGWITDSRVSIAVRSVVPRRGAPEAPPLHVQIKVTQHLQTVP
jgi:hypothetical protein